MLRTSTLFPVVVASFLLAFSTDSKEKTGSVNSLSAKKIATIDAAPGEAEKAAAAKGMQKSPYAAQAARERILINEGWKFYKYGPTEKADSLIYDVRPEVRNEQDSKAADSRPTEAVTIAATTGVLKP